eukprot:SAG22_NODE_360_length_11744_cov_37.781623_11_plen_167_part_00
MLWCASYSRAGRRRTVASEAQPRPFKCSRRTTTPAAVVTSRLVGIAEQTSRQAGRWAVSVLAQQRRGASPPFPTLSPKLGRSHCHKKRRLLPMRQGGGEATVVLLKAVITAFPSCFPAFPCGSTALTHLSTTTTRAFTGSTFSFGLSSSGPVRSCEPTHSARPAPL